METRFSSLVASAFFVFAASTSVGCSVGIDSLEETSTTPGAEGRARFAYSTDCLFDCAVERPMIVGTRETVSVLPPSGKGGWDPAMKLDVRSSDPSKLEVSSHDGWSCCSSEDDTSSCRVVEEDASCPSGAVKRRHIGFDVVAHAAGQAEITLLDSAGGTFERVTLQAVVPAKVDVQRKDDQASLASIDLAKGGTVQLRLVPRDGAGRALQAAEGLVLTVLDPEIASFDDPNLIGQKPDGLSTLHDRPETPLVLRGRAAGATTLRITSPGFESDLPVTVE